MLLWQPDSRECDVILIVVKFKTKPEWSERWLDLVQDFSDATRAEPGNLWFEWSRSVQDPHEFVLVEAFRDDGAAPHVQSSHFRHALQVMPQALAETPRIVNTTIDGATGWSRMSELSVD
jgi:quinol monooxygenase YgiN